MEWLLGAWLAAVVGVLGLGGIGAWVLTGQDYRGVHRGPVYQGQHQAHETELTVVMRWDGTKYVPAPPWTQ
jgi:hypothetical protein